MTSSRRCAERLTAAGGRFSSSSHGARRRSHPSSTARPRAVRAAPPVRAPVPDPAPGAPVVHQLSWLEAIVIGALQGVAELFPVSSLGHSVLLPAVVGGSWAQDLDVSAPESPYLAFIVGLHVATALALLVFFWRDWVRISVGFVSSVKYRRMKTDSERLAWLIVLATIPIGLA